MHLRTRTWFLISVLSFAGAYVFWQLAERKAARDRIIQPPPAQAPTTPPANPPTQTPSQPQAAIVPNAAPASPAPIPPAPQTAGLSSTNRALELRLSNTAKTVDELSRADTGLLLRNALLDSAVEVNLNIPAHLRAEAEPGSFIVQAKGLLTDGFRARIGEAGAQIISYVPNNAYLVLATAAAARQLAAMPQTAAVLPWEPYYKLEPSLLKHAIEQTPLPSATRLNLLVAPGRRDSALRALAALGAVVLSEDRSPFGQQVTIRPPVTGLTALARLAEVQDIEIASRRIPANDLGRARVRVAKDTLAATPNFLDLQGTGITVNVNDTGVSAVHPDLADRVTGDSLAAIEDYDGHGTHVAGTIASSGANGPDSSKVPGSVPSASYRGMAPAAEIFAMPIDLLFGPSVKDSYLQETAVKTNAFISNNSWGYSASTYSLNAASWDAAVRDALPEVVGSQPLIAVFAAGNSGAGGLVAPGTAKNVITVGAIENLRNITNEVVRAGSTNTPWLSETDSDNEIAAFSSLGNVDPGVEGRGGRYKPDLVAPGTFTVSTRSQHWAPGDGRISELAEQIEFVRIPRGRTNQYAAFVPANGQSLRVLTVTNTETGSDTLPRLPIHIRAVTAPTSADYVADNDATVPTVGEVPGSFRFSVGNPGSEDVFCHIRYFITVTNDVGNTPEVLQALNDVLAPNYRYSSGTSMSAPQVTGLIALMQEFFATRLNVTNSPALMKALLINAARSVNASYDFNVTNIVNGQGWGLPNLTNALPVGGTTGSAPPDGIFASPTLVFFEQSTNRALGTGQSVTREVSVASTAVPLRFTLVWTDPPGNPAVGIKLVNDLDLIVTNLDNGEVYVGNAISPGSTFSSPITIETNTVGLPNDVVNNVENVYLRASTSARLSSGYSVTVAARRVNVNAVTGHPSNVAQDYALVISSGEPRTTTLGFTVQDAAPNYDPSSLVTIVTNGVPLLNQRLGANSPLIVSTNGATNQWHFFVVTNMLPTSDPLFGTSGAATNIAFSTFLPPNLSRRRYAEADIDLYVSDNPALTNLDFGVIQASLRSTRRGGTESIVIPNARDGALYYAGVKSEDQESANFGFFAISSSSPFSSTDTNGAVYIQGFPINTEIPDGSAPFPQAALVFGFATEPIQIQNVVVTNRLFHENGGDLFGNLVHDAQQTVLNANRSFSNRVEYVYDDSDSGEIPFNTMTDFPGTLRNFVGEEGAGSWLLTMVDSAPGYTGQVERLFIRLDPVSEDLTNGVGIVRTILPGRFFYVPVEVPGDATNMSVCVAPQEGPVGVYIARGYFPDLTDYDTFGIVAPPGSCITLGLRDSPPLSQGRYFIGIYNPNPTPVTANIRVFIERDLERRSRIGYSSGSSSGLLDDALTNSTFTVSHDGLIADLEVGVRIAHERASDLALHLVSPSGTRILLAENRGGPLAADYGLGTLQTNTLPSTDAGDADASTNVIATSQIEGTLQIDYQFYGVPDRLTVYYEDNLLYDSGLISGTGTVTVDYGPGYSTNVTVIMNEGGNPSSRTRWTYTATVYTGFIFAIFTEDTTRASLPMKFAPPPFTNFNYSVTNTVTNATILANGFEGAGHGTFYSSGDIFSGWEVVANMVSTFNSYPSIPPTLPPCVRLDGTIATNFVTIPGTMYRVSFDLCAATNPVGPANIGVAVRDENGAALFFEPILAPHIPTNAAWASTSFVFVASSALSTLEFSPLEPESIPFIDTVRIEEIIETVTRGIYFLPEESLAPLRGENALGDWTLELWDRRAGGVSTNATLLGWRLNVTFVNTNPPAIPLTNGVQYCGTLRTNEIAYFRIDVPITAAAATNLVFSQNDGELDLVFSQVGEPIPLEPPDTFFCTQVTAGLAILDIGGWNSFDPFGFAGGGLTPTLQPGRRYYLAVRNRASDTNDYCIQVTFDELTPNLTDVIPLTNNVCFGASTDGTQIDYYSFDVSRNALGVQFLVTNIFGADVDLVVRRGLPLPNLTRYTGISTNSLINEGEFIEVDDFFGTRLPGRWYIGVIHDGASPSGYQICVQERPGGIIPILTNTPLCSLLATGQVAYYSVDIDPNAYLVDFLTTNVNGNADLFISTNTMTPLFTAPTNALHQATNAATGGEFIRVDAGQLLNPLTPGKWFLAVFNADTIPVSNCVQVIQYTTNLPYLSLTNGIAYCATNTPTEPIGLFQFDVATNALQVVFETFGATTDVDLYIRRSFPLPPPGPNFFTYASTNDGTTNEYIGLLPDRPFNRFQLTPGRWYIGVRSKDPLLSANPFKVRATQILSNEVVALANGEAYCQTNIPPLDTNVLYTGVQFYSFTVPVNAIQATFETFGANTNVDLFVQYDRPITNYSIFDPAWTNYPYASTNGGATNEFICVGTNSPVLIAAGTNVPVSLPAGNWYVAVVNRDPTNASYCVRASVLSRTNVMRLASGGIECGELAVTNGGPIAGVGYYVFTVETNAILATFETFNAMALGEPPYPADVDLYLARDLCWTNFAAFNASLTNYPYAATNLGPSPEFLCLTTNMMPIALMPGEWVLAVVNRATNAISYCVSARQIQASNVVDLEVGVPKCATAGADVVATNSSIHYYRFYASTGAFVVGVSTFNANGNVDLFVSRDLCFTNLTALDPLPAYPYGSSNPGRTDECVNLATNSHPVALTNGEWFIAVVNRTLTNVNYCVSVNEILTEELVPLTNGLACSQVPVTNVNGHIGVIYHPITVVSNALQLTVETDNASGNIDLYLQRGPCFPSTATFAIGASNAPYASTLGGQTNEFLCVATSSQPIQLTPGEWYVAVVNRENVPVDYCLRTAQLLDTQVTSMTNGVYSTNGPLASGGVSFYRYRVSSNAVRVNFEILQLDADVDLYVEGGFCPAALSSFAYASTNGGTTNELVSVTVASQPTPLFPGDWFIAVRNKDVVDANYVLLITEITLSQVIPLTNAVPFTNTVASIDSITNLPIDYYVFTVSSNAVRAQFEILNPSGNVNLYLHRGLPVPSSVEFDYRSENIGSSAELITVFPDSSPVPLEPGDWYLAVFNTTTSPVTYTVLATEFTQLGTNVRSSTIVLTNDTICFTWTGTIPGVNYYVQGKPNLNYTNWFAVSPTIRAVTNQITWCLDLPSSYHFFRLAEGLSPLSVSPPLTVNATTFSTNGFTLQWTADPSLRFGVEWTEQLTPAYWIPFPIPVTSTDGTFIFVDDGSETGGLDPGRFYRIQVLP